MSRSKTSISVIFTMIIVTGANGFIGSVMVWQLNQSGHTDILAVDSVDLIERNLLKDRKINRFLKHTELWAALDTPEAQAKVTWVIHMGACSSTTETNWEFLKENNLVYSQKIFEWCAKHGKNLIYASSAATYGSGEKGFDDSTNSETLKPLNLYGESKVQFDRWIVKQNQQPLHWYGLKFFNVFGPMEDHKGSMSSVAYKAFHQIQKENALTLFKSHDSNYKDGEQLRDFVYVKDVTRWMMELMDKKPKSDIYNMGFGKARTWLDLAGAIFNALGTTQKINWIDIPENIRNQYQYFTEAKMSKWKSQGLSDPQWPLETAVKNYVTTYLSQEPRRLENS